MHNDTRLKALTSWLAEQLPEMLEIQPASEDASFRRYFRISSRTGESYVAMDAPPHLEPLGPFLDITQRLIETGVHVPRVHACNRGAGFILLDDLGTVHYQTALSADNADTLYADAFSMLLTIQHTACTGLPDYDRFMLLREMALFPEWFLKHHFDMDLNAAQGATLAGVEEALVSNALSQPQVFVHRDYHSRNLMRTSRANPGVLDYQDAVRGPLTYDLVSLLRDAYITWPEERVRAWALQYRDDSVSAEVCERVDDTTFLRWFDLMGLQRHLKVLGIFARLYHRDGKAGYLGDLPRVLSYVLQIAPRYSDTAPLAELLQDLDITHRMATCMP